MATLYHYPFCPPAQRVRLAIAAKGLPVVQETLPYTDLTTPVDLAGRKRLPILVTDAGEVLSDSMTILQRLERQAPDPPLLEAVIRPADFEGLRAWTEEVALLLDRLRAPVQLGFRGLADDADAADYFRRQVASRHGAQLEELVNARYADYRSLASQADLKGLARALTRGRFFSGCLSVADLYIVTEWGPLRWVDGISPPLDLLYYFERVEEACGLGLAEDLVF